MLAIIALVLSVLSLVGVGLVLALGPGDLAGAGGDDYGDESPLTGHVAPRGGAVSGPDLSTAVRTVIEADGGEVGRMSCLDTDSVAQSVTTVCHGSVDQSDWAMVVFFEDEAGNYTVLPI